MRLRSGWRIRDFGATPHVEYNYSARRINFVTQVRRYAHGLRYHTLVT